MSLISSILTLLGLATSSSFANIGVEEFAKLIAQPEVIVLDVRTPSEFAEGHIEGSINVDVNAPDFKKQIASLKLKKDAKFAVYCRSGRRSSNACNILSEEGYKDLSNLNTGIIGWKNAGMKTVK